jgi:hypothetical protein
MSAAGDDDERLIKQMRDGIVRGQGRKEPKGDVDVAGGERPQRRSADRRSECHPRVRRALGQQIDQRTAEQRADEVVARQAELPVGCGRIKGLEGIDGRVGEVDQRLDLGQ